MGKLNLAIASSYGELYEQNPSGTEIDIVSAGTYYKWPGATVGREKGTGYVVGSAANDNMTIGAKGLGEYGIDYSIAFAAMAGSQIKFAIFKNDIRIEKSTFLRNMPGAGHCHPSATDIKIGTIDSGSIEDQEHRDGDKLIIAEDGGDTGFIVQWTFSNIDGADKFYFWGSYRGASGHEVEIQERNFTRTIDRVQNGGTAYNCIRSNTSGSSSEPGVGAQGGAYWEADGAASGESAWITSTVYDDAFDEVRTATSDLPDMSDDDFYEWELLTPISDYIGPSKETVMRAIHTTNGATAHRLNIDSVGLVPFDSNLMASTSFIQDLGEADIVDLRITGDISGDVVKLFNVNLKLERIDT